MDQLTARVGIRVASFKTPKVGDILLVESFSARAYVEVWSVCALLERRIQTFVLISCGGFDMRKK